MFAPSSRYAGLPTATTVVTGADGEAREVTYVRRRLLPRLADLTVLSHHTVQPGERLDHLAARYAGDPTQFWRLCDATEVLRPADLEVPGTRLPIAAPVRQGG
ncbi:LysM domain-containing protein [Nocardioides taihuensis]|uniref:LysM domain-containing protein n=1 Tax=Nocardioides taihuensis TaxID=1835606 RepID=A0ABW0BDP9_9ACTN